MRSCQVSQESALKYLKKLELQGLDSLGPSGVSCFFSGCRGVIAKGSRFFGSGEVARKTCAHLSESNRQFCVWVCLKIVDATVNFTDR